MHSFLSLSLFLSSTHVFVQALAAIKRALPGFFPPLQWLREYPQLGADASQHHPPASLGRGVWNTLRGDLQGGVTAGVLMIPQGIAYAMLAGIPISLGLYSGFVGTILYCFFGTSRQLNFGPLALVSLMIRGVCESYGLMTPEAKAPAAIALGFIVGMMYLILGVCRFGFVVNFLSQPVLSGFTSAAAVIIFISQLSAFLGVTIESSSYTWLVFGRVCAALGSTHGWTLLVGALCAVQILGMPLFLFPLYLRISPAHVDHTRLSLSLSVPEQRWCSGEESVSGDSRLATGHLYIHCRCVAAANRPGADSLPLFGVAVS
jgi:MFS superfamily sulfate permease-like transporter